MTAWCLYSEPFARTGNIAAEGFRKLLGRPTLGLLQTVIREAMQNSIDAATPEGGLDVLLRTRVLSSSQLRWLSKDLFGELPKEGDASAELRGLLKSGNVRVFEICDFGTIGLGGPTRADAPVERSEEPDFVNFLRNVGAARDTHQGGGTYGYGKTSLYSLSACSTIVVDTQTRYEGHPVRRMMACQLGSAYDGDSSVGRRRFTGRHWWGASDGDGGVDPLSGNDAAVAASQLGLPERTPDRQGTSILILAPRIQEESDDAPTGADLVETVLWNFWPRMCACVKPGRRLNVQISVDGEDIPCPAPEEFPPLDLFADAFKACREREGDCVREIRSVRPKKLLGHLAIRHGMRADRHPVALRAKSAIPRQASHIALMRPVELVVRYMPGEPFPDRRFEWGGVFICSDEDDVERAFADSEPPAHDDWITNMLPRGPGKTFVNVALKRLAEKAKTYVSPRLGDAAAGKKGPSLARTAVAMGKILDASSARGPGRRGGSGDSKRKTLSISPARFVRLALADDGRKLAVFRADVTNDGRDELLRVRAEPHLVMDGGAANAEDVPVEFTGVVESLRLGDRSTQDHVLLVGTESGVIECMVPVPEDAAVGLRLQLVAG